MVPCDFERRRSKWGEVDLTVFRLRHGISWDGVKALKAQGAQAVELSSLRSQADIEKVLSHPLLVLRHDAAGIARETGVMTSEKRLAAFIARLTAQAATRQLLEAHGAPALTGRLRVTDGGVAPRATERPRALPTARVVAVVGAPPLAADAVWLRGCAGETDVTIQEATPLPEVSPAMRAAQAAAEQGGQGQQQQGQQWRQQGQQQQGQQQQPQQPGGTKRKNPGETEQERAECSKQNKKQNDKDLKKKKHHASVDETGCTIGAQKKRGQRERAKERKEREAVETLAACFV